MNQDENSPWQYKPDDTTASTEQPEETASQSVSNPERSSDSISWQAAEFIEHHHPAGWYGGLFLITAAITALVYLTTKDYFATGTIVVVGIITGVFAGHKPAQVQYEISSSGLKINDRSYPYSSFKSFSVFQEGPLSSINLFPLKRFMPPVSAYFEPGDEKKVADAISNFLPYEERKLDAVDRLSRRLRL